MKYQMKTCLFFVCFALTFATTFAQSKISGVLIANSSECVSTIYSWSASWVWYSSISIQFLLQNMEIKRFTQSNAREKEASTDETLTKKWEAWLSNPIVYKGFEGNAAASTPNDNDIAVSNNGTVVSVVNSSMQVLDDTGKILLNKSLTNLVASAGVYTWISDPTSFGPPKEINLCWFAFLVVWVMSLPFWFVFLKPMIQLVFGMYTP